MASNRLYLVQPAKGHPGNCLEIEQLNLAIGPKTPLQYGMRNTQSEYVICQR